MHPRFARPYTLIAILAAGALLVLVSRAPFSAAQSTPSATYTNDAYGFSFVPPEGLTVTQLPQDSTDNGDTFDTFVIEDAAAQHGVQLIVSSFDDDPSALTADRIEAETGLHLSNVAPVEEPAPGLSFTTDNDAWGGRSSDIWFIHAGTVYELTTSPQDAALMHAIASSWQFLSP